MYLGWECWKGLHPCSMGSHHPCGHSPSTGSALSSPILLPITLQSRSGSKPNELIGPHNELWWSRTLGSKELGGRGTLLTSPPEKNSDNILTSQSWDSSLSNLDHNYGVHNRRLQNRTISLGSYKGGGLEGWMNKNTQKQQKSTSERGNHKNAPETVCHLYSLSREAILWSCFLGPLCEYSVQYKSVGFNLPVLCLFPELLTTKFTGNDRPMLSTEWLTPALSANLDHNSYQQPSEHRMRQLFQPLLTSQSREPSVSRSRCQDSCIMFALSFPSLRLDLIFNSPILWPYIIPLSQNQGFLNFLL